ncbi:hypothetical protein [Haloarchaeobius sp. DT45]|uniref:hypothetical protein n=1 Tax=Haloarchaeobius sp. DT45 TaxID=3446116 RepID=UPI003F6A5D50
MSNENLNLPPAETDHRVEHSKSIAVDQATETVRAIGTTRTNETDSRHHHGAPTPATVDVPSWRTGLSALGDRLTPGRVLLSLLLALEFLWLAWFATPALGFVVAFGFVVSLLVVVPYLAVRIASDAL